MNDANTKSRGADNQAPKDWVAEFQRVQPAYGRFTLKLQTLLQDLLQARSIDFHLLECRTKSEVSFREKVTRASKNYANPVQEITDLSGLRIITYYEDDADAIGSLIKSEFSIDSSHPTDDRGDPSAFGYKSAHYIVSLNASRRRLLEWDGLGGLKAEIQVRTVLQHAWAAISHKLQYKREADVPIQFRRKLFRLSALFELADDEFVSLRNASGTLTRSIEARLSSGDRNILIDHLSVGQFIEHSVLISEMTADAMEIGFSFEDSDIPDDADRDSISDLVTLLSIVGVTTIAELEAVLADFSSCTMNYLRSQFKQQQTGARVWTVTAGFICQLVLIGATQEKIRAGHLMKLGWNRVIATRVIEVARAFQKSKGLNRAPQTKTRK